MMYSIRGALMFLVILSVAHIGRTFLYAAILEGIEALQYSHCASTQCLQDSDEIVAILVGAVHKKTNFPKS